MLVRCHTELVSPVIIHLKVKTQFTKKLKKNILNHQDNSIDVYVYVLMLSLSRDIQIYILTNIHMI